MITPHRHVIEDPGPPSPRPLDGRRQVRFGDDEEDLPLDDRRSRGHEQPTHAGMIGFILTLVSFGLLGVMLVLYYGLSVENEQHHNPDRTRLMLYWFMILDFVSFLTAVTATVFAARGLSPANPLYRGWSLFALIFAIFEILFTLGAGLFLSCCVLLAEAFR